MATLLSFDHFCERHLNHARWRKALADGGRIDALLAHYVVPFVACYNLSSDPNVFHYSDRAVGQTVF